MSHYNLAHRVPDAQPAPPHHSSYPQQPPELVDESDTSPAVTSPLTPNWAAHLPDFKQGRIDDWDQASEQLGFPGWNARHFHISGVPTLTRPQPKGLSMALTGGSIQSAYSQHRPSPSEASFTGGAAANLSGLSRSVAYQGQYPQSLNISSSSQSQYSNPSYSDHGSLPSLITPTMTDESSSISTNMGDPRLGHYPRLDVEDEALVDNRQLYSSTPPGPTYQCAFWFLDCAEMFDTIPEWKTHCLSHFKGNPPPRTATCPLCPAQFSSRTAWDQRMDHVLEVHHNHGFGLEGSRPDFDLFKWLWKKRIIDDATLKDLEGNFDSLSGPVSTVTEGRTRETRREPRQNRRSE